MADNIEIIPPGRDELEEAARLEAQIQQERPEEKQKYYRNYEEIVKDAKALRKKYLVTQKSLKDTPPNSPDYLQKMHTMEQSQRGAAKAMVHIELADVANSITLRNEGDPDMPQMYQHV